MLIADTIQKTEQKTQINNNKKSTTLQAPWDSSNSWFRKQTSLNSVLSLTS